MSQEELLTHDELNKFDQLLQKSSLVQEKKREALCRKVGIVPGSLTFINHPDDSFATLLIYHLHDTRNKTALCLLFNEIEKELKGGDWRDKLDTIRGKLQCNASSSGSAPSFNPLPNQPDLRKLQSSFTKLLTKLAENIFNRFIVGLIMVVFAGIPLYWDKQKTQNPKRAFSPEKVLVMVHCVAVKDIKMEQNYNIIHKNGATALEGNKQGNVYLSELRRDNPDQEWKGQRWKFIKSKSDTYQIQQSETNRYLDSSSLDSNYNVSTTPNKEDTTKQQWKIENSNVYYIVFINNTNQQKNTLDAGGQGKKVYLHEKNGGDFQDWCVTPAN